MSLPDNGEGSSYYITGDDVNSINILIEQYKQVNSIISDDVKSKKRKIKPIWLFERFTFMKSRWSTGILENI